MKDEAEIRGRRVEITEDEYDEDAPTDGFADMLRYIGIGLGWMFFCIGLGIAVFLANWKS